MKDAIKVCPDVHRESGTLKRSLLKMFFLMVLVVCGAGVSAGRAEAQSNSFTVTPNPGSEGKITGNLTRTISPFSVDYTVGCGGTVSPTTNCQFIRFTPITVPIPTTPVPYSFSLSATAGTGYTFSGWSGNCSGMTCSGTWGSGNVSFTPSFSPKPYTLSGATSAGGSFSSSGGGGLTLICPASSPSCSTTKYYDDNVTVTASPGTGYDFSSWAGGVCAGSTSTVCSFTIGGNTSVGTATFTLKSFTLSGTTSAGGTLLSSGGTGGTLSCAASSSCSATKYYNNSVTVTATPSGGYTFVKWTGGVCTGSASPTCGPFTITAATSVGTASFAVIPPTTWQVTVTPPTGGKITSGAPSLNCSSSPVLTPCSGTVSNNGSFTVTAEPYTGYSFGSWGGAAAMAGCGGVNCTISPVTADKTVSATFTPQAFNVSASQSAFLAGEGSVTSTGGTGTNLNCGNVECSVAKDYGTTMSVLANPAGGYAFTNWSSGPCSGTSTNPCVFTVTSTTSFVAVYNLVNAIQATAPVNGTIISTGGSGSNLNCGSLCYVSKSNGDNVTVTASPSAGYAFSSWGAGFCAGQPASCPVAVVGLRNVGTANFVKVWTLSATAPTGGSITSSGLGIPGTFLDCGVLTCSVTRTTGSVVTVSPYAYGGYYFDGWGAGACNGQPNPCTVTVNSNLNVTANFVVSAIPTYQLTATNSGTGGGTVIRGGTSYSYPYNTAWLSGTVITLTAVADGSSTFSGWSGCDSSPGTSCTVTMNPNKAVVANFTANPITYTLSATAPAAGTGSITSTGGGGPELSCLPSGTCSVSKISGTVVTVTANAASGYDFSSWDPTGVCAGVMTNTCTVMMNSAKNVGTANFVVSAVVPVAVPDCLFVTGISEEVLNNGTANSGVMDFNDTTLADQYRACTRWMPGTNISRVKGWVWDSNLGWVSFYCADEDNNSATPYTNAGIACGNELYGTQIEVDDGQFRGFAWGDGMGWISFNCLDDGTGCATAPGNNHIVRAEVDPDVECLGEVYSDVKYHTPRIWPPPDVCPNTHFKRDSYAWSDNVGWIDLAGVNFVIPSFISVDVELTVSPDPTPFTKDDARVANGTDEYEIRVSLREQDAPFTSIYNPAKYDVYIAPIWTEDSVKMIQTDQLTDNLDYTLSGGGAVSKPLKSNSIAGDLTGDFVYDPTNEYYVAKVTSKAPTSNMNQYVGLSSVSNEMFFLPAVGFQSVMPNNLVLEGVDIWILDKDTGNCALPGGFDGVCKGAVRYNTATTTESDFKFAPAGDVKILTDEAGNPYVDATSGIPENFKVETKERPGGLVSGVSYEFKLGLDTLDSCYDLVVLDADGNVEFDAENDSNIFSPSSRGVFDMPGIFKKPEDCPESSMVPNPYLYSKVSYTVDGENVQYYSAKLPRVSGTAVVNPVAVVKGSVYSTGISNAGLAQTIRSLGNVSTNILRDTIFRNVSVLVAGVTVTDGDATLSPNPTGTAFEIDEGGGVSFLTDSIHSQPMVYYFHKGDVTIGSASAAFDIGWKGNRTIIVVGGSVFIDQNLYNGVSASPKPKLGIIALKDLSSKVSNQAYQGNIYINPKVTNLQANIFADGSVFSYNGDHDAINSKGEPIFTDVNDYQEITRSQLLIEGSIASQNTIGGAAKDPPIIGTGELSTGMSQLGSSPSGAARSLLYDLNFLRSFGAGYKRDTKGNAESGNTIPGANEVAKADGSPWTVYDDPPGDLVPSSDEDPDAKLAKGLNNGFITTSAKPWTDFGAVYVTFDPPPATLPGFNVVTGAEVTVRPQ